MVNFESRKSKDHRIFGPILPSFLRICLKINKNWKMCSPLAVLYYSDSLLIISKDRGTWNKKYVKEHFSNNRSKIQNRIFTAGLWQTLEGFLTLKITLPLKNKTRTKIFYRHKSFNIKVASWELYNHIFVFIMSAFIDCFIKIFF